ncbi:MAG: topoisomerase DNA-binding C4 zinc finger domain-containing protein [Planctomycetota bacterium]
MNLFCTGRPVIPKRLRRNDARDREAKRITGELVIRQGKKGPFLGCGRFPKCRTIISHEQLQQLKQLQADGKWPPETIEEADKILGRKKYRKRAVKTK